MKSSYTPWRTLWKYLGGTLTSRAGDEMAGPALLLLGFAVTGKPAVGSALLAGLTIGAAVGGPLFGALLDRSPRPDRVLAVTLASYTVGVIAVAAAVGRLPVPLVLLIALAAGLFTAAVAGGWTSQLPRIVAGPALDRGFALDATTYSAASLAGPALAALVAAVFGARTAVVIAAALVALAVPSACSLSRYPPPRVSGPRPAPYRQMAAGFAAIVTRRRLLRATVTSAVSYVGLGMLLVCCPLLGAQRLGGSARGALLISAIAAASLVTNSILARRRCSSPGSSPARSQPDARVLVSTVVMGVSMALVSVAPGWLTLAAVALSGVGEGPQLTALFSVRHRESPEHLRGQIFTTAASLKVAGLAAGAALAGPLAGRSVTACLLLAAGFDLCAAAAYVLIGPRRSGWPQVPPGPRRTGRPQVPPGPRRTGPTAGTTARSE